MTIIDADVDRGFMKKAKKKATVQSERVERLKRHRVKLLKRTHIKDGKAAL